MTRMDLRQYVETALVNPLEISNYDWFAHEVTGDYLGSSGLYLRSRDFAKLGQLYLNKGLWNERSRWTGNVHYSRFRVNVCYYIRSIYCSG
ncbi:hypothetical protein PBPRB1953 [Photobacterium profundum SS9]|uniref:Uncharacterized protein n=1 Tax=Photobacterium profundum (strain SS9) TaxID=298386 RepID=Q6LFY2_PHOPR|nr:hypothetical protein PBPRB1953 [Photobacterium profundum SS9]